MKPPDPVWGVQSRTPTTELFPAAADRAASSLPENKKKKKLYKTKYLIGTSENCDAAGSSESPKSISEGLSDVHTDTVYYPVMTELPPLASQLGGDLF